MLKYLKEKLKGNELAKEITTSSVKNYFGAMWRKYFHYDWEQNQYDWRKEEVAKKSPKCIRTNECYCLCNTNEKLWETEACTEQGKCYPKWMNKQEWEFFSLYKDTIHKHAILNLIKKLNNE